MKRSKRPRHRLFRDLYQSALIECSVRFAISDNALSDAFGDTSTELASHHAGAFCGVADEAAFDEYGGILRGGANDVEVGAFDAAISHLGSLNEIGLDVGGERVARGEVVVSFGANAAASAIVVVVYADENGISSAVPGGGSVLKGNEHIATARHDDFEAFLLQELLHATSGVECEVLFVNITDGGSTVMSSVPGIEDYRVERVADRDE